MEEIQALCEVPKIAHFCSLFKEALDLPDFDIEEFEEALASEDEGNILMLELLFKLLNGCYGRQDIGADNYELYLKDIFNFRLEEELKKENPLKGATFFQLTSRQKVQVLDHLCHFRLDAEDVGARLKGLTGECMRVEPLGTDAQEAKYWYFYGTRLYKEDQRLLVVDSKKKSKKKNQKKKKKKKKKGRKGKQVEEEDSSDDEGLNLQLLTKQDQEEEEEQLETKGVKKAARLRVNLEKKDEDDAAEEDMDLDIEDDVESLKLALSSDDEERDDDEEVLFKDHSSDEDYNEKGAKKQKCVKKKKKIIGGKTPKVAKTPAAKTQNLPQILRVTPKSARLRAKFGYMDEDTGDSKVSDDRLSSSSRSTTKSDRLNKNKKCQRKRRLYAKKGNETTVYELSKTNDNTDIKDADADTTAEEGNQSTCQHDTEEVDMGVDIVPREIMTSAQDQSAVDHQEKADVDVENCMDDKEEHSLVDSVEKCKPDKNGEADWAEVKDQNKRPRLDRDSIKQEAPDEKLDFKTEQGHPSGSEDGPKDEEAKGWVNVECEVLPGLRRDNFLGRRSWRCREREDTDSQDSKASSLTSIKSEKVVKPWVPRVATMASQKTGWHLVCEVLEDWEHLVSTLDESGGGPGASAAVGVTVTVTTSRNQRSLLKMLRENFLPEIPAIQEEKEKERKRRELEMAPRRLSTRLIYKKKEQEDRERILQEAQEEEDQMRAEEDEERKRKQEAERKEEQRRQREERDKARAERAKRVKLREERAKLISEGKEIPPELMNGIKSDGPAPEEQTLDEDVIAKLHKVLGVCFKHDEAWPFVESVEEKIAPGYFDLIKMPMNLSEMEEKLKNGRYHSKDDFMVDMDLIVDNCESYNGEEHDFSMMARNLRTAFHQGMRRFFHSGRQKKDDDDFVLEAGEGRGVQPVGRRYKARREASRKALDSFQDILSDMEDSSDHQIVYRPVGSGTLRNQSRSFQGYVSGRGGVTASSSPASVTPRILNSRVVGSGGVGAKQMFVVSKSTEVIHKPGSGLIEVRTIQPGGSGKPGVPHKVALVQRPPGSSGTLTAILNSPAGDGSGRQNLRCIIPSSMVSLLKDRNKAGAGAEEGGGGGRAVYVSISRPLESQTTASVTGSSGSSSLTSVLSTIHQSGGTVRVANAGELVGGGTLVGKSLLRNTILQSPGVGIGSALTGGTQLVAGGKSLLAMPGNRQVFLTSNNQILSLGGNSPTGKGGNVQLGAVPSGSQPSTTAGSIQTAQVGIAGMAGKAGNSPPVAAGSGSSVYSPATTTTAGVSGKSEDPKPPPNTLHITKDVYLRLLAENKIRVVQVPGGKPIIQLQPGTQLVHRTTAVPPHSTGVKAAAPAVAPAASVGGSAPLVLSMASQAQTGGPRPLIVAAAPRAPCVKKSVVVNPWSVNDRVVVSTSSSPLSVNSVPGVAQSAVSASLSSLVPQSVVTSVLSSSSSSSSVLLPGSNLSSIAPSVAQKVVTVGVDTPSLSPALLPASISSFAPVNVTQTVTTTMASGTNSFSLSSGQVATTSLTPTLSAVVPVCSVPVSPGGQVLMSVSSPLMTQSQTVRGSLQTSPPVTSPRQVLYSPAPVSQTSPVSAAPQMVILSSAAGFPSAQRSLFPSCAADGASCSSQPVVQTVSSAGPSAVTAVCASQSVPGTVASLLPNASVNLDQELPVVHLQNRSAVVSPKTVSPVRCVTTPVINSVAKTVVSVPVAHTVNQPVSRQRSICSSPVASEINDSAQMTSPCGDFSSATSVTVCGNLSGSSSSQGQVTVSSSTPVNRNKTHAISPSKKHKTVTTLHGEESPTCQSWVQEGGGDHAAQGRSRRNVVSRDYKVFAGYSSKTGSCGRRVSTSKVGGQSPECGATSKSPSLKRRSVDGSDPPQAKVTCMSLSPSVVLNDCGVGLVQASQQQQQHGLAGHVCSPMTSPDASPGLQETAGVSYVAQNTAAAASNRQDAALPPPSSHHSLLSDQENVNSDDPMMETCVGQEEGMEVDGVLTSAAPPEGYPNSSPLAKSPLKHADRNIFHQLTADLTVVSSAEKSPRDASVSE